MSIDNDFQRLLDGANKKEKEMGSGCCTKDKSNINSFGNRLKFWNRPIKDENRFIDERIALLKGQLDMLKKRKKELGKTKGK